MVIPQPHRHRSTRIRDIEIEHRDARSHDTDGGYGMRVSEKPRSREAKRISPFGHAGIKSESEPDDSMSGFPFPGSPLTGTAGGELRLGYAGMVTVLPVSALSSPPRATDSERRQTRTPGTGPGTSSNQRPEYIASKFGPQNIQVEIAGPSAHCTEGIAGGDSLRSFPCGTPHIQMLTDDSEARSLGHGEPEYDAGLCRPIAPDRPEIPEQLRV